MEKIFAGSIHLPGRVIMDKKILIGLVLIFFAFLILCGIISLVMLVNSKANQCLSNPFSYAAGSIKTNNGIFKPLCSCTVGEKTFYFNEEGIIEDYDPFRITSD